MPELPEVESVRRGLCRLLRHRRLLRVWTARRRLRQPLRARELTRLLGEVVAVRRRAKYLLVVTRRGTTVIHLGMTGHLLVGRGPRPLHTHVEWALDGGERLRFIDPRRFGLVVALPRARLERLGPEPLTLEPRELHARLDSGRPIKVVLLDQTVLAGIGNIYASEALFRARIHPERPARSLDADEARRLMSAVRATLHEAIRHGGTTLSDFRGIDGTPGENAPRLRIYGRAGSPCVVCKSLIQQTVQAGRSTFFCPVCQPRSFAARVRLKSQKETARDCTGRKRRARLDEKDEVVQ